VKFTIRGRVYDISREDILKAIEGVEPEPLTGKRKYYIEAHGRKYPIKQVIGLALGLPRASFTAMDAYRILTKLGFEVREAGTRLRRELAELIFSNLAERMSTHEGLEAFATCRAKFEGWLKVELAAVLKKRFENIVPEKDGIDLVADGWAFEIKTINTSYRRPGTVQKTRPITENIEGVVNDVKKLRKLRGYEGKAVVFVVFPLPRKSLKAWEQHLEKVRSELEELRHRSFSFKNNVPGTLYIGFVR